ncbi:MAG TPA: PDZ domain-containing protein [Myxococcota bacterium]|nr:PDZ domain-containing protein [Myxococcota bacterium]
MSRPARTGLRPARFPALALAVLAGAGLGAGAAVWIGGRDAAPEMTQIGDGERVAVLEAERGALERQLAEETAARAALAVELERLRAERVQPETASRAEAEAPEPVVAQAARPARGFHGGAASPAGAPHFDPAPVLAAGFPREEVERFRSRLDELDHERLYLRDQAAREGWLGTERFRAENGALGREFLALRNEFDEGLYDWVLYSTGHPNRVAVSEVLSGSAAEAAGLRSGDVILRYDARLVLSPSELRDATVDGRAGELVAVEVQRAGDPAPLRVFVPRGPLGVRMAPTSVTPPPAG